MICYIFGIGDRHADNIMIDQNNCCLTHIDYDAIFDYGKVLPVPETVPYRLTNEFQSAMGFF